MGEKWTTSGGWRLKSKQNRTFAARASQKNPGIGIMMTAASANHKSNVPQTHPTMRKRNGGGESQPRKAFKAHCMCLLAFTRISYVIPILPAYEYMQQYREDTPLTQIR
jgi:hypothetical protein